MPAQLPPAAPSLELPPVTLKASDVALELDDKPIAPSSQKLPPKKARSAVDSAGPSRLRTIVLVVLLLGALGGGGFYAYKKFFAGSATSSDVGQDLAAARKAIGGTDAGHWDVAAAAAARVLQKDEVNAEALAIGAEGVFASAYASGVNVPAKLATGKKYLATVAKENLKHPRMPRAQALAAIPTTPEVAIDKLKALAQNDPKDASIAL